MSMADHQAEFVRLLTEHQQVLRSFIISLLPGCDEVKDVLQETNLVLWEKKDHYRSGSNFRAWAFTVARNKVMQHRERSHRAGRFVWSPTAIDSIEEYQLEKAPEYLEARLLALQVCLKGLKSSEQQLIRKRYAADLRSADGESATLNGTVRVLLCRIRRKLRDCVEKRMRWRGLEA